MVPRRLFIDLCCPDSSLKGLAYVYKFAKEGSENVCRSFNALEQNSSSQKCYNLKKRYWDFPGGSLVKTLCFYCRGHGFYPWLGNKDAAYPVQCDPKIINILKRKKI